MGQGDLVGQGRESPRRTDAQDRGVLVGGTECTPPLGAAAVEGNDRIAAAGAVHGDEVMGLLRGEGDLCGLVRWRGAVGTKVGHGDQLKVEKGKLKAGFALSVEPSKTARALSRLSAPLRTLTIDHDFPERTGSGRQGKRDDGGGEFKNILDRKLRGHEEEPFSFSESFEARVAELADAVDSKSTDESLVGSTPTPGTTSLIADELAVLSDSCQKSRECHTDDPETMTKAVMPRKTLRLSARAARLEIRVRKVPNRSRGEVYGHSWLVIVPAKVTGGHRLRKQFKATESREAVDFAEGEANKAKEQGQTGFYLTPEQVTDAKKAQGIL